MKIGTNPFLAKTYADLDINAGTVLERKESIEEVGKRIFHEALDVASGRKLTRAEQIGFHNEFKIWEQLWRRSKFLRPWNCCFLRSDLARTPFRSDKMPLIAAFLLLFLYSRTSSRNIMVIWLVCLSTSASCWYGSSSFPGFPVSPATLDLPADLPGPGMTIKQAVQPNPKQRMNSYADL